MTVINTNVGALMARTYATKANEKGQTAMERFHQVCVLTARLMMLLVWLWQTR